MAEIYLFPLSRQRDIVWRHAEAMARIDAAAADDYLFHELELVWDDLERRGVSCAVIEREVISLGRAIRAELWRLVLSAPGGVA